MSFAVQSGSKRSRGVMLSLVVLGLAFLVAVPASAKTFTVNFNGDQPDFNVGDGVCNVNVVGGPVCTLRAAIEEANNTLATDTIVFRANLGTINVVNGELNIFTTMNIRGNSSAKKQRINGFNNAPDGIFEINSGDVRLQYLILEEGSKSGDGGCIDIDDSNDAVRVQYSQFLNCEAGDDGGAIASDADLLDITGSLFQGNAAFSDGGAINTEDDDTRTVTLVKNSQFKNNFADDDGGAMSLEYDDDVEQQVRSCRFINNTADGVGGGVAHFGLTGIDVNVSGITIVQNSRFKNNSANFGGAMCDGSDEGLFFPQGNIDLGGNVGHFDFSGQQDFFCDAGTDI